MANPRIGLQNHRNGALICLWTRKSQTAQDQTKVPFGLLSATARHEEFDLSSGREAGTSKAVAVFRIYHCAYGSCRTVCGCIRSSNRAGFARSVAGCPDVYRFDCALLHRVRAMSNPANLGQDRRPRTFAAIVLLRS